MNQINNQLSELIRLCENFWGSRERTSEKRIAGIQKAKDLAVKIFSIPLSVAAVEILKNKQILRNILPTQDYPEIQSLYKNLIAICQNGK